MPDKIACGCGHDMDGIRMMREGHLNLRQSRVIGMFGKKLGTKNFHSKKNGRGIRTEYHLDKGVTATLDLDNQGNVLKVVVEPPK